MSVSAVQQPELIDRGLDDRDRAVKLFPNQGLWLVARAWAGVHPRAIQYLEQAPVLAVSPGLGRHAGKAKALAIFLAFKLTPLCEAGAALKEVMRAFGVAPPLRRLAGFALCPRAAQVVAALSDLPPAMLGNIVPERAARQRAWLQALGVWMDHLRQRRRPPASALAWAAQALADVQRAGKINMDVVRRALVVADFATAPGSAFSPAWRWTRAVEEAELWHGRITLDSQLQGTPFKADSVIDIGPHPDVAEFEGHTFTALRTPYAIWREGHEQRHCVATYIGDVIAGRCHIVSVGRGGKTVATLEVGRDWSVRQLQGKANSDPGPVVGVAAYGYAAAERRRRASETP